MDSLEWIMFNFVTSLFIDLCACEDTQSLQNIIRYVDGLFISNTVNGINNTPNTNLTLKIFYLHVRHNFEK